LEARWAPAVFDPASYAVGTGIRDFAIFDNPNEEGENLIGSNMSGASVYDASVTGGTERRLMTVFNNPELLVEYRYNDLFLTADPEPLRVISLVNGFNDTEAVTHLGGTKFAVAEEDWRITVFDIASLSGNAEIDFTDLDAVDGYTIALENVPTNRRPPGDMQAIEGLAFDPGSGGGAFYLAEEREPGNGTPHFYRVANNPSVNTPDWGTSEVGVVTMSNLPTDVVDASDIHYQEVGSNRYLYILSEDSGGELYRATLTADLTASVTSSQRLPATGSLPHTQAEGITFTPGGADLVVLGEVNSGTAHSEYAVYNTTSTLDNRRIFYNNSNWDGLDAAAEADDDAAIATDKSALLPGGTAVFANYTSFEKGINGIMVDIANLPNGGSGIAANDFTFKVCNNNTHSSWASAPNPTDVDVRLGAGANGSDRVTILWADQAITKNWLQVTVLANGDTGLVANDYFYFGNAIGEVGNTTANATVSTSDQALVRLNTRNALNPAPLNFAYDINRNRQVNASDEALVRLNINNVFTDLNLIVPGSGGGSLMAGGSGPTPSNPSPLGKPKSYGATNPLQPPIGGGSTLTTGPTIVVGSHTLLPNTANQAIQISVSGDAMVPGLVLYVQVGDGGPERTAAGIPTAGTDGPSISAVDIKTDTIFEEDEAIQINQDDLPQWTDTEIILDEEVEANGLLATIYIDTTGFTSGTYDLKLSGTLAGATIGASDTDFLGVVADITNGSFTISGGGGGGGGGGGAAMGVGTSSELVTPAYNTLTIDLGSRGRARMFSERDFQLFTSADRSLWSASNLRVSISVSLGAGSTGGDLILIRFLSPPPVEETPYFRVGLRANAGAQNFGYRMLDYDLRTWERV
jgi:uncharacterized protein YjiK